MNMATSTLQVDLTNAPIVDATKKTVGKRRIVDLLKKHQVNISAVQDPKVNLENVIPTLLRSKIKIPEDFFRDMALELEMPFLELDEVKKIYRSEKKSEIASVIPYPILTKYKIIPLQTCKTSATLAVSNPLDHDCMMMLSYMFGAWKKDLQVVSLETVEWAIDYLFSNIHKNRAMCELYNRAPEMSAHKVLFPKQKIFITILSAIVFASLILDATTTLIAILATLSIGYFVINPFKIYISLRGFKGPRALTRITKGELVWVLDQDLPVYTVLVPIFHEAKVLGQLMKNLYRLNYPKDKLEIKLLFEQKDEETLNEARRIGLFGSIEKRVNGIPEEEYNEFLKIFDPIIVPDGKIKTKPRACNYGLMRATGELCVIYDAEDDPDPDQLKKAAIVFLRSEQDVVCLQSKLNFYNADENVLTRWFSIEYSYWYEFYLSGLDWINAPIPLGGTSNHFRAKELNKLRRWDPYNVTEDADVGIRLARQKLKTEMIESTTYEEATIAIRSWIQQRSRWYKGHVQTYLVHMRQPIKLVSDLGFEKFLKFQLTFGANIFIPIINPLLWATFMISIIIPTAFNGFFPGYIQSICLFNLIIGNTTYILMYVLSSIKLKKYRTLPFAILMPLYWGLVSVAGWRGLFQLIRRPFYWEKTVHGVSKKTKNAN